MMVIPLAIHWKRNKTLEDNGEEREKGTEGKFSFFP
jgi:hypothetical protein